MVETPETEEPVGNREDLERLFEAYETATNELGSVYEPGITRVTDDVLLHIRARMEAFKPLLDALAVIDRDATAALLACNATLGADWKRKWSAFKQAYSEYFV